MILREEASRQIESRLREMAQQGLTRHQAAEAAGCTYQTICRYANQFGLVFQKRSRTANNAESNARADEIARRYQAGETLAAIGADHNISRERVRQILTRTRGFDATDGGQFVRSAKRRAERESRRERDCWARRGCSFEQYSGLLEIGREMREAGAGSAQTPTGAFASQKANAARRSIAWKLTLWEWWTIWQQSGRWNDRGRGHGYMMCRKGDAGAYSIDNVVIAPGHFNASFQERKKSRLPTGVSESSPGRFVAMICIEGRQNRLGIYPTAELAHDAYLSALAGLAGHEQRASA